MHSLAILSMKNRALIALVTIVVAVFGGIALTNLKQELTPSIDFPELVIVTSYPGASPQVVENDVSTPIESAIQNVPNLDSTSAVSSTNQSLITAKFDYGSDLDTAEQKINQAINNISSRLPSGVQPQVFAGSISDLPILELAVTSDQSEKQLAADIDRLVLPDITKMDGVASAQLIGAVGQRVTITPDPAKMAADGVSVQSIQTALQQNGVLVGAGSITADGKTLNVQAGQTITSVDEIAKLPLVTSTSASTGSAASSAADRAGSEGAGSSQSAAAAEAAQAAQTPAVHTIGDVATVAITDDPTTSISRVNGKPALTIAVTKTPTANTVEVSNEVKKQVSGFEASLGHNAKFTSVFDQAPFIEQSINSLAEEGLLGLLFAVVIILIFLLSIRSTLVTAISIPTSVLITFIGMWASGYTLNIITLGGLTIAIGRVVDDSIVVIENIKRHLVAGVDRAQSILSAVREVAGAVTASTITTVAVFLPIAFVGDVTGELFRPFAVTVTIALLSSLLVALTIVPVLAYWFLRPPKPKKAKNGVTAEQQADDEASHMSIGEAVASGHDELEHPSRLQRGYLPIINFTLKHSAVTIIVAVLVLGGTLALAPLMKTNFLGSSGQNTLSVTQTFEPGTSLQAEDDAATVVEKKLRGIDGIETVQLSIGTSGSALADAFGGGGANTASFSITTDENADQDALQATVQKQLKGLDVPGDLQVSSSAGFGGSSSIEVDITASNQADLHAATDSVVDQLDKLSSVNQVTSNLASTLPYIAVSVNRTTAAEYGLSEVAVGTQVSQAMQPTQTGTVSINDTSLTIYIADKNQPMTVDALKNLQIQTVRGPQPLSTLADVHDAKGPATVTTQKGLQSAAVTANPVGDDLTTANTQVSNALKKVDLPSGASATIGGVTADQGSAFSQLGLAMLAAILIVYVVMVATFKSLRQPLLLLVSIPFAATGAIGLQIISGVPLGVASLIGMLMLIGIVVTNAIVLIDLVNQYRTKGLSVPDAVRHGASRRLRPILMTALATIFALLPMALGVTGHGGFISQPLAIIVIGGLVSSTLLTLVVLPTLYNLVEGARDRRRARKAAKRGGGDAAGGAGDGGTGGGPGGGSTEPTPPASDAPSTPDEPSPTVPEPTPAG
ncbi:efflux RND transporter permease subunit [Humibacter ginsenosidimutans]|uniref:Efflux RND transporter permease subunit n=1 Tax=Humibacter ginsenosidimutans TaxID=2599293 RepID=A0A5B8M3L0_9MICO|nr:efflux RND transporter permease subunit [Humibacter ginsenosidimutans]QDZ15197.1 efflux RND transporter permease subunit [Humibacter ginsenosidimutans]